jgi:16S rRNA (adenine1518-N6/adenine1519-N6)-dimethyltransferase
MNYSELGIKPIKGRSQHFLLDESVVEAMCSAAQVTAKDTVVEIGPGPGILTEKLLKRGARVIAVELDPKLCSLLRERFAKEIASHRLHLIEGDFLQTSAKQLLGATETPYKVVANIPYAITSDIIIHCLEESYPPISLTLLMQREVAERLTATPKNMSSIAVFMQTHTNPEIIRRVPAGAFYPPPKVESAVLHATLKTPTQRAHFFNNISPESYFLLVKTAFTHKRKKLRNTLRAQFSSDSALEQAFKSANISPDSRPEELTIKQWQSLAIQHQTIKHS